MFLICPPGLRGQYKDSVLEEKVQHRTRILNCSTEQGIIYISRHIKPDVLVLGNEHSWMLEQIRGCLIANWLIIGWAGQVICVRQDLSEKRQDGNITWTSWQDGQELDGMFN
jgi:hypothetical protein